LAVGRWTGLPSIAVSEHGDQLPAELDTSGYVGPYLFPDNARRRWAAVIYAVAGAACIAVWAARRSGGVLVNRGVLGAGILLVLLAAYHLRAGYRLVVRDLAALTAASRAVGFAVGHASAQLAWRGLRSRPTWRILLYSADNPPTKRGIVLVDGVDGTVIQHFVEDNPEDWSQYRPKA
jgi:hypothetical protein